MKKTELKAVFFATPNTSVEKKLYPDVRHCCHETKCKKSISFSDSMLWLTGTSSLLHTKTRLTMKT